MKSIQFKSLLIEIFCFIAAGLVYYYPAQLGLALGTYENYAAIVWPPAAIGLTIIFFLGYRYAIPIFVAATAVNLSLDSSMTASLISGVGNSLECMIGVWLLRSFGFQPQLMRLKDVFLLVSFAAFLSSFVGSTIGTAAFSLGKNLTQRQISETWIAWFFGDAIANLILAPFIFVWVSSYGKGWGVQSRKIEFLLLLAATLITSVILFGTEVVQMSNQIRLLKPYLMFPILVWAALRFGQKGTTTTILLGTIIGIHGVLSGFKITDIPQLNNDLLYLQGFLGIAAATFLGLSAAICQYDQLNETLRRSERRLRRQAHEFRAMFELSGVGHCQLDVTTGKFVRVNQKFCDLVGYSMNELRDMKFSEITHVDDINTSVHELEYLMRGLLNEVSFDKRFIRKDGSIGWCQISAAIMSRDDLDRPQRTISVVQDITERKHAEEHILKAKQIAEQANLAKSAFLANVSHEIRTPLGAMLGFSDLLIKTSERNSDSLHYAATIKRNGELLARIIDDILDLSKVEAGKLEIEQLSFSLRHILDETISLLDLKAREKGVHLSVKSKGLIPDQITTDPMRLRQILLNIIGNAIKFTERGGVDVSLEFTERLDRKYIEFTISDTGPGLSQMQSEKLFQAFTQADSSTTRRYGGTGLGLFLAKRLAIALNGDLILKSSAPGIGSTFVLWVEIETSNNEKFGEYRAPRSELEQEILATPNIESVALRGKKILLVEDVPDNQMLISLFLTEAGAKVDLAEDGIAGVRCAMATQYDLVLMDIQMPKMDGLEATKRLRAKGFSKPIIALTAHAMKDEREKALKSGFDDYLTKPINHEILIQTAAYWTRREQDTDVKVCFEFSELENIVL